MYINFVPVNSNGSSNISLDHFFSSLQQYYNNLRQVSNRASFSIKKETRKVFFLLLGKMFNPNLYNNKSYDMIFILKNMSYIIICLYNLYKKYKVHVIWLVFL